MHNGNERRGRLWPAFFLYNKILAWGYILLIVLVLPLYLKNGYDDIAGGKYVCFKWGAMILIGLGLPGIIVRIIGLISGAGELRQRDAFVLFLGVIVTVSAVASAYPDTVIWGHIDWHMGAWTFAIILGGWFLVTGYYEDIKIKGLSLGLTVVVGTATLVALLAILNCSGVDPFGFYVGMDKDDWNYQNLISTIGNSNWYVGYMSLGLGLSVAGYLKNRKILYLAPAFLVAFSMIIQGSDTGLLTLAVVMLTSLFFVVDEKTIRTWLGLNFVILVVLAVYILFRIPLKLPLDSLLRNIMIKPELAMLVCLSGGVILAVLWSLTGNYGREVMIMCRIACGALVTLGIVIIVICNSSDAAWARLGCIQFLRFDDAWGSKRGLLWRMTLYAYEHSTLSQKLVGVGPDCYSAYMYEHYILNIQTTGQWTGASYANAHNEWLNMLLTLGAGGLVAYLGILISTVSELKNREYTYYAGILLCAVAYVVTGTFTFNHILSSPQLFVILSMALADNRGKPL